MKGEGECSSEGLIPSPACGIHRPDCWCDPPPLQKLAKSSLQAAEVTGWACEQSRYIRVGGKDDGKEKASG